TGRIRLIVILACTALFAASAAVYGQAGDEAERDPFLGTWTVEIVFVPAPLEFSFSDSGHYTVTEASGEVDRLNYTLRPDRNRMRMQMDEDTFMEWRYSFTGENEFHLYPAGEDNELMKMLLSGFDDAGEFNELTKELLGEIRASVRETILGHPTIRGRRTAD
ncbi:MAG: hypothetical protein ACOCX6_02875, partial [bacterium]